MMHPRNYEIKRHFELSNVLSVITDCKLAIDATSNNFTDYYLPVVISMSDYFPFGMPLPGRTEQVEAYRWGFNSMEKDNELKTYRII